MGADPGRADAPKIAVLGQGSIGRRHAANLLELGCEVVTFDPLATEFAAGARRCDSAAEALDTADAAVVASPNREDLVQIREALERGCHVLAEKPLAASLDGVDDVIAQARERSLLLAVAMNLRF